MICVEHFPNKNSLLLQVDCAIFGHLSQVVYVDFPFEHKEVLQADCANLLPYMDRIRSRLWPDWDALVAKGTFC